MTDKREITRQIEERLGSEGSKELAESILPILECRSLVEVDASQGYFFTEEFNEISETVWLEILAEAA